MLRKVLGKGLDVGISLGVAVVAVPRGVVSAYRHSEMLYDRLDEATDHEVQAQIQIDLFNRPRTYWFIKAAYDELRYG
tara:strand:+ start:1160 stop:1393 length:234 start_codon:yes stop_codon:yes gene_type:complete